MDPNNVSGAPKPVDESPVSQSQFAQPPVTPEAPQGPQSSEQPVGQQPQPQQSQQEPTDVFGIISLVTIFVGFQLVGVILGYLGMKKAKKEGYSPILSKIGFWVNLAITVFVGLWIGFVIFMMILSAASNS